MINSSGSPGTGNQQSEARPASKEPGARRLAQLSLVALGVVFGDIGTSPLYALRECFHGAYGIAVTPENVLGVLSLMFWALLGIVTLKYLVFVLRADHHGEGGVLALTALVRTGGSRGRRAPWGLIAIGLFAACLLYGDGMITPAISVLSAVEGIGIITPAFQAYVIPLTIVILAGLFFLQHRGTARVGNLFGPIVLVWFFVLAVLGGIQVAGNPQVFQAVLPGHAVHFFMVNRFHGAVVLGAVFLVVTGAEALYADMGHFGRGPIRLTWVGVVLPALVLNYFGQGAMLLAKPEVAHHPFYALVPSWAMTPMVVLATVATIIASQAVITGSFSLTQQAIQLGYLPRMRITHTSAAQRGQIYVGPVNWMLMVCTIGLVIGFQSSSKLAAAYGMAVASTMLITTILFYYVARNRWGWSWPVAGALAAIFFLVDACFFSANITKILHGAWFPLVIGGLLFTVMVTWERGRQILAGQLKSLTPSFQEFRERVGTDPPERVTGQAMFLSGNPERVPAALVQNLTHNKILHSEIVLLHFKTADVPRVPSLEKVEVEKLGGGFHRVVARYGYMEEPKMENTVALAHEKGLEFRMEEASFFLGREKLSVGKVPQMRRWRCSLFTFLSQNAMDAASFFAIPPGQVIEVGVRLEL